MPRPRSTLFPYTTLFRSRMTELAAHQQYKKARRLATALLWLHPSVELREQIRTRSEERFSRNAETEIYTLSLHDALPISNDRARCASTIQKSQTTRDCASVVASKRRAPGTNSHEIGRAVQQECRDRDLHSFPTRRSSDLE